MNLQRSVLLLLAFAVLTIAACATGSAVVTGTTRDPIASEQVRLYLEPPADFEVIGLVSASSGAGWNEQGSVNYAIEELKKQAAKLGANGVLLVSTGDKTTTVVGGNSTGGFYAVPASEKTVQGRAIFVKAR
jgi:opacity protein-like surface antigen